MSKLDDVIKNVNKQYGFDIVGKVDVKKRDYDRIPFKTPTLSYLFRGGLPRTVVELAGMPSAGKAQPLYSKILTQDGWKCIGDIAIGDTVYGEDGKLHDVIGVFPQGKKPIYEITFTDGATCRCSDEHLWEYTTHKLISNKSNFSYVKELKHIIEDFNDNPSLQGKYIFPTNVCIDFPKKDLKIPPYILGLLLGDGGLTQHNITFTNAEKDVLDSMKDYLVHNQMDYNDREGQGCRQLVIRKSKDAIENRPLLNKYLDYYNLLGKSSAEKFIPVEYLLGDETQRLELLAGLINTDGYVDDMVRISSVSKKLIKDIIELCRSLGISASVGYIRTMNKANHSVLYNMNISLDKKLYPYLSNKHKAKFSLDEDVSRRYRYIKTIKYIGEDECQCIYIDSNRHLYITDDYCVTHNTTLCYSICGEAQKLFKQEWEDEIKSLEELDKPKKDDVNRLSYLKERGYQKVVYLDSEFSSNAGWMAKNGVDVDDLVFIAPENQTAEQLFQIILDLIDSDCVGLVVLDSIPALVSQQLMAKTMEEKTMGGISGALSVFSSKLLPMCNKHDCAFIGINQTRDDISGYHQVITPGGRMWKHSCSIRLLIRKGKYYDSNYKELTSHCEQAVGNYAEVEVLKNKATKPDRRMTKFSITYDCGVDGVNDCFEMAVALHIIDKSGAWYSDLDDNDIPKTDSDGNMLKWQGKARAMEYIKSHIDYYNDLLNTVNQEVSKE